MTLSFASPADPALDLHIIAQPDLDDWLSGQPDQVQNWIAVNGFTGALGQVLMVPQPDGAAGFALAGYGSAAKRARKRFPLAAAAEALPTGTYRIASGLPEAAAPMESLGWLLTGYAFDRYATQSPAKARLIAPDGIDAERIEVLANAEALTRDLVNIPAADMGPDQLQAAAEALAQEFDASVNVISGEALLQQNFPMIHAVGRAAEQAPRLIEMNWGETGPKLTLVGKGVCFDTGGLDLKPAAAMGLMKKDMGGAANVLGLARMIMALRLPV
ncbi:MAG: leucyl aminopeptidase family protein, partial [Ruegeria sp.]|nr:leucyl aminopeptidase family protein [Ruegeria sp.]